MTFAAFLTALLLLLAPGVISALFTAELFDRCLWAVISAVVGAGAVAFAGALPVKIEALHSRPALIARLATLLREDPRYLSNPNA